MRRIPVSVVIPLYNKAAYIRRCLESVRRQTFGDFEAVVVDDGSTDASADIAEESFDSRFRIIRQANRGEGAARNRGISEARSDLIAFLDSDDAWEEGFLEAVVALAEAYPKAGWFATGYRRVYGLKWDRTISVRPSEGTTRLVRNYLEIDRSANIVSSSSVAIRRSALQEIGAFPEGEPIGADHDLWVRLALHCELGYDARILAIYHSEAEGRVSHTRRPPAEYPAQRTLRKVIAGGKLSANQLKQAVSYQDYLRFKRADAILYGGDPAEIVSILQGQSFSTPRFRFKAGLLSAAARLLPMRLVAALRLKPVKWLWSLRSIPGARNAISGMETLIGRTLVLKAIRARPAPPVQIHVHASPGVRR